MLDARAVIYWPAENTLLVSDLHLEKGSYYARFASPLPHYDSLDTLVRLQNVVALYQPHRVVCLGDSFHDLHGFERLSDACKKLLFALCKQVGEWVWILGNHDPALHNSLPGKQVMEFALCDMQLRHEPQTTTQAQIIGHYHPKISHSLGRRRVTGKTYLVSDKLLIMPAFGSYTGGLKVQDEAIQSLLGSNKAEYFLLANHQVWKLS